MTLRPRLVLVALLAVTEEEEEWVVDGKAAEWRASGVATTDHRRDEVLLELPPAEPADDLPLLPVLRGLAMMHIGFGGHQVNDQSY